MSNPPTERPWPVAGPDTGWWRGDGPPPPPDQDQFHDHSLVPAEPLDRDAGEADAFPLWPTSDTAPLDDPRDGDPDELEGVPVDDDGPLPPPAFLGAPGPSRVRADDFATVILEAVVANQVPLAPALRSPPIEGPPVGLGLRGGAGFPTEPSPPITQSIQGERALQSELDIQGGPALLGGSGARIERNEVGAIEVERTQIEPVRGEWSRDERSEPEPEPDREPVFRVTAAKDLPPKEPLWPVVVPPPAPARATRAATVDPSRAGATTVEAPTAGGLGAGERATPVQGKKPEAKHEQWPPPQMRAGTEARASTARVFAPRVAVRARPIRHLRQPGAGLAWLLLFALLAAFFAYTAAEPTWLALGHATPGIATVGRCDGTGVFRRCDADFVSRRFEATGVALVGAAHVPGTSAAARMVGAHGRIAYAGSDQSLRIRGLLGLGLVLLCGLGIAWVTGAGRLSTRRNRGIARLLSVGFPLVIALGVLAATY